MHVATCGRWTRSCRSAALPWFLRHAEDIHAQYAVANLADVAIMHDHHCLIRSCAVVAAPSGGEFFFEYVRLYKYLRIIEHQAR